MGLILSQVTPPSPRLYENYQVPHEQIPPQIGQIGHKRFQV